MCSVACELAALRAENETLRELLAAATAPLPAAPPVVHADQSSSAALPAEVAAGQAPRGWVDCGHGLSSAQARPPPAAAARAHPARPAGALRAARGAAVVWRGGAGPPGTRARSVRPARHLNRSEDRELEPKGLRSATQTMTLRWRGCCPPLARETSYSASLTAIRQARDFLKSEF